MNEKTEIKWDSYGNPIFYPELEIEEQPKQTILNYLIEIINKIKHDSNKLFTMLKNRFNNLSNTRR
jgi:RNA binding exosome subunit